MTCCTSHISCNTNQQNMIEKEEHKEEQNEFAENIKGEIIYILDAESGKKGYFCIGCKSEMQAVRSQIKSRKSYFRHDPKDVRKSERECTFSNQNYRHSQAISILNRIKRIKAPTLYKYPPKKSDGKAIKLKDSAFINAKYTKAELTFYETDDGEVKFGKNPHIDHRNLLIRPDVTFFNAQNEPILLIEIVVTHKINHEKLAKIKRLGIDTVQVTIPKDSLENIEKSFSLGRQIKWIHNNEQERTEYIHTPNRDTEGVSQIDELQRALFEESFKCRESQIRNLIRRIKKHLGSEQYRAVERGLTQEIQRVEKNTERAEEKLKKYRNGIRERVERTFQAKREKLDREEKEVELEFDGKESAIEQRYIDLEERYLKKRGEIEEEQRDVEESTIEIEYFESTKKEYRAATTDITNRIDSTRKRKEDNINLKEGLPKEFERLQNEERANFRRKAEGIESEKDGLPGRFGEKERELEAEFAALRKRTVKQIENSDIGGTSELSGRLKRILKTRSIFHDWEERQNTLKRNRRALECLNKGTYKNWDTT